VHAGVHPKRRYAAAKAGFGGGIKAFPDAVTSRAMPRLPDPAEGVFAAIEVVLRRADEGRKAGQSCGLVPARALTNESFPNVSPRCDGTFSLGRQFP